MTAAPAPARAPGLAQVTVSAKGLASYPPSAGAAACWIVIACGPMVTVPVRSTGDVFRATVNVTVAERSPFGLAGGAIHETALVIVHAQPVRVSMATRTSPPFAETAVFAGATMTNATTRCDGARRARPQLEPLAHRRSVRLQPAVIVPALPSTVMRWPVVM